MEYTVEDLSPVKRKISVTVPTDEVNASLSATIAMYRTSVDLKGFRKGKVPTGVIESRFRKEVYSEATQDLVNVHINEIVGAMNVNPVSRIDFEGGELVRDEEFKYALSFEILPEFDLPSYDGMDVEQERVVVKDDEVDEVLNRIRNNMAEIVPLAENRPAKDGEIAVIDFAAYENGEAIEGIAATNFQMALGEKQALEDFEKLVKTIAPGETKEGDVAFPADFINTDFAGKTVVMKVTVHSIQERKLPELNDEMAQKAGGFESVQKMRDAVVQSYKQSRGQLCKSQAQSSMLEGLLKTVDYPLPESMVEMYMENLLQEQATRIEKQGKSLESLGKTLEQLREEVRPEAEHIAKTQIFLVAAARKEGVEVSEQEVDMQLQQMAMQSGQDFRAVKEYYTQNNLLFGLRDRILADKAMDAIYQKANITEIEPKELKIEGAK